LSMSERWRPLDARAFKGGRKKKKRRVDRVPLWVQREQERERRRERIRRRREGRR
jgi:hypothetical protein